MTASYQRKHKSKALVSTVASILASATCLVTTNTKAEAIVVSGNPNDYIVPPGTGLDGVVRLSINRSDLPIPPTCTGALLPTGLHILTAAHCLTQAPDILRPDVTPGAFVTRNATAVFELPTENLEINAAEFFVSPLWNGIFPDGNDIAILKLASAAPVAAQRYDINRNTNEFNQVVTKVGYGLTGNGNTGATVFDGIKRSGQNTYDATPDISGRILAFDFDNGLPANDALGAVGIPNLGLGLNEVTTFQGDSGGPGFINGLIAGITSFGNRFRDINGTSPDIDNQLNGSFGEVAFDTRVSTYASYVDSVLAGRETPVLTVPEPSTLLGMFAFGAFAARSLRKRK